MLEKVLEYKALTKETTVREVEVPDVIVVEISSTIPDLKEQLSSTDYKIIKCYEYQLAGLELPYEVGQLHTDRQVLRNKINELETQVNNMS